MAGVSHHTRRLGLSNRERKLWSELKRGIGAVFRRLGKGGHDGDELDRIADEIGSLPPYSDDDGTVDARSVGTVFRDATFAPEMVVVPSGRFWMGSPEDEAERLDTEGPRHEVEIGYRLAVGRYAVTFSEYLAFCAATGHKTPDDRGWGRELHPVINVSWEDAQAYLAWLNGELGLSDQPTRYRLLSQAEWEYCCRAGTDTPFSFGETITTDQANYDGNYVYGSGSKGEYRRRTVPVGSLPANAWGFYEMHGNVWEWVEDRWHENYEGAPLDGSAWTSGNDEDRVLRGGSWLNDPTDLRSAFRLRDTPGFRYSVSGGFRVSRTLSR